MGFAVGNSGGASTEVGGGTQYLSRVSMAAVSNGLMYIPEDKTLVFEDGIPYLRQAKQVIDICLLYTSVFKTAAIDHSATSPKLLFRSAFC